MEVEAGVFDDIKFRLNQFIEPYKNKRFEWGKDDCTMLPAKWLAHYLGLPLPDIQYSTDAEAHAIIEDRGGLVVVWDDWLSSHGVRERIGEPKMGDVAIIDTRLHGHVGGICASGRVLLMRTDKGGVTFFGPVRKFVKVWAAS